MEVIDVSVILAHISQMKENLLNCFSREACEFSVSNLEAVGLK